MSNTKFKSGDKVVFCKSSLESGMIDAKEGDVFTVHIAGVIHVFLEELDGVYHVTHFEHYVEKEKVMEKYIPKVGDKVKGFKFYGYCYPDIGYAESMNDVIGKQGTVFSVSEDRFVIDFGDSSWTYPLDLARLAKVEEPSKFEDPPKEISHEDSQIDWEVGQVVWDVRNGRGIVKSTEYKGGYPIFVEFDLKDFDGKNFTDCYTLDGRYTRADALRSLFFSEPKIIAETKPPKKPFTPVFKQGDTIIVKWADTTQVLILEKETERQVKGMNGQVWDKDPDVKFYKLGEQVKFS